jgi:hydroxyacylglutathione hydrolase
MKKTTKRILIAVSIVILALIAVAGSFAFKIFSESEKMKPAETMRINDTVYCIRDHHVNAFLFKESSGWLMVDAGLDEKTFLGELNKLGLKPEDVNTILLTHTDRDHIAAIGLFRKAKVLMHKEEVQMIDGRNGKFFSKPKWKFGHYAVFNSNDTLKLNGLSIRVIFTPGHTPGSCCFLINGRYLAAGDNVSYLNGKFSTFNNFFNMNTEVQRAAIAKIPELNTTSYVLTAHYGIVKNRQ